MCEKEGRFVEAQTARKRLKELRRLEEQRKREQLILRHVSYLICNQPAIASGDESPGQCSQG